jgi:hypothetical protein
MLGRASATLLLTLALAPQPAFAKVVEDGRYHFRADLPGVLSTSVQESDQQTGPLMWRAYTSTSPGRQPASGYTAAVKAFETDSADVRTLFEAGENDASQSLGIMLVGRRDGTFGAGRLPSLTLSYQSGRDGAADMVRATVLLVVKGTRLYEVTFSFSGAADQTATATRFFRSFAILE